MIDWVEAGVYAVDRTEKRQKVHPAKKRGKRPFKKLLEVLEPAACESIDVGDELDLILQLEFSLETGLKGRVAEPPGPSSLSLVHEWILGSMKAH